MREVAWTSINDDRSEYALIFGYIPLGPSAKSSLC